ncbi:MAG TPA: type VI secretion system ATPase TssH, partial [bacterium]|nr:type VI secretion system ATPase TssH [bacterium]
IDDIVIFNPLGKKHLREIVGIMLSDIAGRLAEREITLDFTDAAKDLVIEESFEPEYGARPIRRYLERVIETELATRIIKGELGDGDRITVDRKGDGFVWKK